MPRKKDDVNLDPALVEDYLTRRINLEREAAITRQDLSDLDLEFKGKSLNITAVKAVLRAERALAKAKTPEDELDTLAEAVKKKLDITDI
jgi:uncharacterized protein (UPF0335 family)